MQEKSPFLNPSKLKESFINLRVVGQLQLHLSKQNPPDLEWTKYTHLEGWGIICDSFGKLLDGVNELNGDLCAVLINLVDVDRYVVKRLDTCYVVVLYCRYVVGESVSVKRVNFFIRDRDIALMLVSNILSCIRVCKI